ncbi:hypothetical protein DRP53_07000 [candidate division WOR-3 bacterium]|uniref:Secretion system C-terminal sorting domain-containing protein n=1 Tax=candidate division WOR-3 bacterium TaxID=2052148 RepID=A0A660SGK9_UNCW3|nr:MAG: hypothetical protein DRP53_07000 [candidate division WOR-3 bacterium]
MRYLIILALVVPVFATPEIISPANPSVISFTGVPKNPSPTVIETLFYDDGSIYSAWAWYYGGNAWGYYFSSGVANTKILAVGYRIYDTWPQPGANNFTYRVTDWDGSAPSTTLDEGSITKTTGDWTWYDLPSPITDSDGDFCIFWVQEGDYPNCCGLCEDAAQEDPTPDWHFFNGSYGHGFPRNDFLIRVVVDKPGVGETPSSRLWSVEFPTLTKGIIDLSFNLPKPTEVVFSTYDLTGKLVTRTKARVENSYSVDLSHLPNGIYFLRVESGNEVKTGKIILVH